MKDAIIAGLPLALALMGAACPAQSPSDSPNRPVRILVRLVRDEIALFTGTARAANIRAE